MGASFDPFLALRGLPELARRAARPIIDFALPPRCPVCGVIVAEDDRFCLDCWSGMEFLGPPCCERCGAPFDHERPPGSLCGACLADPPVVDRARAVLRYGDAARTVALRLKYGRRIGLAKLIARQMMRHVPDDARARMLVIPVPLHRWRLWWRGFNQSALIATHLARESGIDVDLDLLLRARRTPPLRGLGGKERSRAVRGAFALAEGGKGRLAGRTVLLIDDIHTSGATADACARTLRRGGAREIHLLCWARVLRDGTGDREWRPAD